MRRQNQSEIVSELNDLGRVLRATCQYEASNRAYLAAEAVAALKVAPESRRRFKPVKTRLNAKSDSGETVAPTQQKNRMPGKPKARVGNRPTQADYKRERALFLAKNPLCQCRSLTCTKQATDIHHTKGRAGRLLTDANYFMAVCRNCHDTIHHNPGWAYEKGFLVNRASLN